jgi:hypothetical protein
MAAQMDVDLPVVSELPLFPTTLNRTNSLIDSAVPASVQWRIFLGTIANVIIESNRVISQLSELSGEFENNLRKLTKLIRTVQLNELYQEALGILCATLTRVVSSAADAIMVAKRINLEAKERRRMYETGVVENKKLKKTLEEQLAAARGQKRPLDHVEPADID